MSNIHLGVNCFKTASYFCIFVVGKLINHTIMKKQLQKGDQSFLKIILAQLAEFGKAASYAISR